MGASVSDGENMNVCNENLQDSKYNCIVLLGMHRSGTSIFANILAGLGVNMGKRLRDGDDFNKYGYYEDLEIKNLNQEILADWRELPSQNTIHQRALDNKEKILDICKRRNQLKLWGWKDPRTCITVEYWHYYLYKPFYIIVNRNTNDIANSLMRRERKKERNTGLSKKYWTNLIDIYRRYTLNFLMKAQPDYMLVDYDYLVKSPLSAYFLVTQICEKVGLDKKNIISAIRKVEYKNES